ncbi:MAG: hypothetical protein CXZ00_06015 [Acidobacteria bacterium]|nr:MAG: hypothetical protein CXZ00_06015 [Acidobacteriota bacterium]
MDKCEFSEFSYGYCLTEDLIVGQGTPITAAPVFPSLVEEGQAGVGYDVRLNRPGTPLFLQFKLVHQMVRGNANEARMGHFSIPFYRMHLRPRSISDQHESLLSLELAGNDVFYVAPGFHTIAELNTVYAGRRVWNRSLRIKPSRIGPLPDDRDHHVTFKVPNGQWRFYSEDPSRSGFASTTDEISRELSERIAERGKRNLRQQIEELDFTLVRIVNERNIHRSQPNRIDLHELGDQIDPVRRVAYLARQFFDCQLFFVTLR